MAHGSRLVAIATILMAAASAAEAQRLPVRHYGLAEGLPHNTVTSIYQDRKGFLWIGTFEGLARFDGYRFVSYSTVDGLGHDLVNDIAEDRGGRLWVATNGGGVARLGDGGDRPFVPLRVGPSPLSNAVNAIAFDAANALWCATDDGLYRAVDPDAATPAFEAIARFASTVVTTVFVDSRQRVWTWVPADGLRHLDAERQTWTATEMPRSRRVKISGDRRGRVLLAGEGGLFELGGTDATSDRWRPVALPGGAMPSAIAALQDARDTFWIATAAGMIRSDAGQITRHGVDDGLPPDPSRLLEDRDGNVWIGSSGSGLYRVLTTTIVNIAEVDGRPLTGVTGVFESLDGRIYARLAGHAVVEVTGTRATSPARPVPANQRWAGRRIVRSRTGDWWVVGSDGICRMRGPGFEPDRPAQCQRVPAGAVLAQSTDTLDIPELYEDPQGRIWFGAAGRLWWLDASRNGPWHMEPVPIDLPAGPSTSGPALVPALADRSGSLWLLSHEFVVRVAGGRAETVRVAEGVTPVQPRSVFLDSKGRLWIGTRYGGVAMTAQPEATALRFVTYTTQHGLSSNAVWSIAEDRQGRIYFGTGRGLDRLDPSTGAFRHFTIADGLAGDIINQCIADRQGAVWVATPTGLSRLMPDDHEAAAAAPLTYLTRIQIVGDDVRVAETGARQGPALTLAANRNSLLLQYVAPSFRGEHRLHYQYRLDGLDRDWTSPTEERTVTYARLAPGSYRFQVRAIGESAAPGEPAVFEFTIRPPFWRQWWFLTVTALSMAALLFGVHRLRMRRLVVLHTLRNQIATDLHDDIGAGLAQVAILSEVARRQTPSAASQFADIATLARTMRDSMSDIVWAIDPKKDRVTHLAERMRQFAVNTLASDGTRVDFQAPHDSALESVALAPDRRRHLLLILKEAVTNVARHAGASQVTIALGVADSTIHLNVEDDGRGFDPSTVREGHGLGNLRSRSRDLGGDLQIHSAPGRGTRLVVQIPIR